MTEGIIWKQIISFAVPLVIGDLLQQMYSIMDSIVVGQYVGTNALASISTVDYPINTIIGLFTGLSLGATVSISRAFGAKDYKYLKDVIQSTILFSIIAGFSLMFLGIFITPWILKILKIPDALFEMTKNYLLIYFSGALGLVIYNMCGGILRAVGDSKRPMYALIASSLINISLNLLMVLKFHLGVVGVAVATIISQFLSGIYLLYIVTTQLDDVYRVELKHLYIRKDCFREILYIGLPVGIEKSLLSISNSLVSAKINWFGPETMAAWGIYRKLDQAVINMPQNIGSAASTFIGQNAGAKKTERIKACATLSICMAIGICLILSSAVIVFRAELIKVFDSSNEVLVICSSFIILLSPLQWVSSLCSVESGILRGCGDSVGPMVITCLSYIAIRQLYLQIGWLHLKSELFVISSFAVGWISGAFIMSIYLAMIMKKRVNYNI